MNDTGYDPFDSIALFNTILGLINIEKNSAQHMEQEAMQKKLDEILSKVERIERTITDGKA